MEILAICSKFAEGYSADFKNRLETIAAGHSIRYIERTNPVSDETKAAYLSTADIIIGYFFPLSDLQYCKKLKLLLLDTAGAEGYAFHPAMPKDTIICNASGAYGRLIAEHALTLLLSLERNIPFYTRGMENCLWQKNYSDSSVEGKHVLILGMGDIGTTVASYLRPMLGNGTITGVRRTKKPVSAPFDACVTLDEVDSLLPEADIIVCALPGAPGTKHFFSYDRLSLLKPEAVLVNVGRGSLIDSDALAGVMDSGRIAGAGLDVTDIEPLPPEHRLWHNPRVLITPHAGGTTVSQQSPTYERIYSIIFSNLENYLKGEPLHHVVHRELGY